MTGQFWAALFVFDFNEEVYHFHDRCISLPVVEPSIEEVKQSTHSALTDIISIWLGLSRANQQTSKRTRSAVLGAFSKGSVQCRYFFADNLLLKQLFEIIEDCAFRGWAVQCRDWQTRLQPNWTSSPTASEYILIGAILKPEISHNSWIQILHYFRSVRSNCMWRLKRAWSHMPGPNSY